MNDHLPDNDDTRGLRLLRRLVTVLTIVMIVGVSIVVALLAVRLNAPVAGPAPIPENLALSDGTKPIAVTRMDDNIFVLTEDRTLLVLNPTGTEVLYIITRDMVERMDLSLPAE